MALDFSYIAILHRIVSAGADRSFRMVFLLLKEDACCQGIRLYQLEVALRTRRDAYLRRNRYFLRYLRVACATISIPKSERE